MITISWGYVHTGGLNLISVQVFYRVKMTEEYLGWVEGDGSCTSICSVDVFNLTAGSVYVFSINASNEVGYMTAICPEILLEFGKPSFQHQVSLCINKQLIGTTYSTTAINTVIEYASYSTQ